MVTADDPGQPPQRTRAGRLVHELFAAQASRTPGAVAVIADGERLTYHALAQAASGLARRLTAVGAGPDTLVGVHTERGAAAVCALLAIMESGAAYLPLDPGLPPARLSRMCGELHPAVVLSAGTDHGIPHNAAPVLMIGEAAIEPAGLEGTAPLATPHPDSLCYAIYTSGSTGAPKAVAVTYANLAAVISGLTGAYGIRPGDRVLQLASLSFDTSIEQMLVALANGATVMLPPPGVVAADDLLRYIASERVTVADLTPTYWHRLLAVTEPDDERLRCVRLMITGGDLADPADCRAALLAAPHARLLNAYGLTETSITSTIFDVSARPGAVRPGCPVPAGTAVAGARVMILDERQRPVPAGTDGEICIGGPGIARGYLGRPALTAERFLPDADGGSGARMYRTGDLGRWDANDGLVITGRTDRQLKVRGFRVEPGEVEQALAGHPAIDRVSVTATGGSALTASYTVRDPSSDRRPTAADLRHYLLDRLPGYMVPDTFTALDQVPAGDDTGGDTGGADAGGAGGDVPRTPVQAGVARLWAELLKRDHVGLDEDFFALGGDSLLAAEMLARVQNVFGISGEYVRGLTRSLLRGPTPRGFAVAVADALAGAPSESTRVDFAREAELGVPVRPASQRLDHEPPRWQQPRDVLLTGATGFLGAHLLRELLTSTSARVWCLVRASESGQALRRIADAAERYELPAPPADRVIPLPGDLAAPRLGLSAAGFADLAARIDVIYHSGALVNFIYPYSALRAANVGGTRELIRLAGQDRGIPLHYVSTTAVLAGLGVTGTRQVTEDTPLAHGELLRMGYVETKYVAEELVRNAARAGLPVAIYRPLDIVGRRDRGVWNTATEMCALIRFITDTGLAPGVDLPLDFVPADTCAAAIRHISTTEAATGRTFHLASPVGATLGDLVGRLRAHGYPITEVPLDDWVRELAAHAKRDPSHPMTPFLPLFADRDAETGRTIAEQYLAGTFPGYTRSNTEAALRGSGIRFPPVDAELLDLDISHLMRTGYLTAPTAGERVADACPALSGVGGTAVSAHDRGRHSRGVLR
jgi:amino acid adenylation domain-containing protein/thioester reductase-like protein